MWTRKPATERIINLVLKTTFSNQHKNLTNDFYIRTLKDENSYAILDALIECRDRGWIFCTNGRWGLREAGYQYIR